MAHNVETSRTLTRALAASQMGADIQADGTRLWKFAGDCEKPVLMRMAGRPDQLLVQLGLQADVSYIGYMEARCRKCEACLAQRSRVWAARACQEIQGSTRTWFGTLTVAPEHRFRLAWMAEAKVRSGGTLWSQLSESEQFGELVAQLGPEVGKMLKRVRKNSGARIRYLLVAEAHKDGFPHFHLLLHEGDGAVKKAVLDEAWKLGFTKWRLVDGNDNAPAFYVCKYLAKSALARIRASQKYGQRGVALAAERVIRASEILEREFRYPKPVKRDQLGLGPPEGKVERENLTMGTSPQDIERS